MTHLKPIFLFLLLNFCFVIKAQNIVKVSGLVVNENKEVVFGNVMLLSTIDSSFIEGTSFFEEAFELNNINRPEVLIKLTSLQFQDTIIHINYNQQQEIDLGDIVVTTAQLNLDEVIVKGKKATYIERPDGTVEVLIENTILSSSHSVNEILSKSPEIIVDETGGISIFGKGSAIIYLNGKRITESQLSIISPSNISKIEIIRNPSAKYDAEGAAVINILTKQQIDNGYQAKVQQNISHSKFGGALANSSLNLNYKKGKFSSNTSYTFLLGKERELLHTTRDRSSENVFLTTDLTTDWKRKFDHYSSYTVGGQYDINKNSYISIAYSGAFEQLSGTQLSDNKITDSSSSSFYDSTIDRHEREIKNTVSANYSKSLHPDGSSLFIGGEYSSFNLGTNNRITENSIEQNINSSRLLKNILDLNIEIYSGQVDFTKALKKEGVLEVGAKYSHVQNDFDFDFLVSGDELNYTIDPIRSNIFNYKESIGAFYTSFKRSIKRTNYTIGLRSELTAYQLNLSQIENQTIANQYVNFFPNFSASRKFSETHSLYFSYTARIRRAPYQLLNPVLIYQDPYTSIQGNAELKPQKTHAFEVVNRLKAVNFKLGYNYVIDPFGQAALRGEDSNSYILKRINYASLHDFYTSISRTFNYKKWTSINHLSLKHTTFIDNNHGFQKVNSRPNIILNSSNRFNFSDSFNAEISLWYRSDNHDGLHLRKSMYSLSFAFEKSFLKKALKCRLIANDIFHGIIASGYYDVAQTAIYYNRRWSTDYFRLSFSYDFGKLKELNYKNKSVGASENNRAQ